MDDLLQSEQGTFQGFEVDEHVDEEQEAEMEMEPVCITEPKLST